MIQGAAAIGTLRSDRSTCIKIIARHRSTNDQPTDRSPIGFDRSKKRRCSLPLPRMRERFSERNIAMSLDQIKCN
jgi:hypothetical protein